MIQSDSVAQSGEGSSIGRGPTRPFPVVPIADALQLPRSVSQDGVSGRIVRITLLKMLEQAGEYRLTRDLITSASKYGLISGSFASEALTLTDLGKQAVAADASIKTGRKLLFEIAIASIAPFQSLYDRLINKMLPDLSVLSDEMVPLGVTPKDSQKAANVFIDNARFLGLTTEIRGREHMKSIDTVLQEIAEESNSIGGGQNLEVTEGNQNSPPTAAEPAAGAPATPLPILDPKPISSSDPAVHIDVQIHIDSSASSEQIDQIFSSMARHLYGRES